MFASKPRRMRSRRPLARTSSILLVTAATESMATCTNAGDSDLTASSVGVSPIRPGRVRKLRRQQ